MAFCFCLTLAKYCYSSIYREIDFFSLQDLDPWELEVARDAEMRIRDAERMHQRLDEAEAANMLISLGNSRSGTPQFSPPLHYRAQSLLTQGDLRALCIWDTTVPVSMCVCLCVCVCVCVIICLQFLPFSTTGPNLFSPRYSSELIFHVGRHSYGPQLFKN